MAVNNRLHILPYYNDRSKLLKHIRKKDLQELKSAFKEAGRKINSGFDDLAKNSVEAVSVFYDNTLLACGGVYPSAEQGIGSIWLLSTKDAEKYPVSYYKACVKLIKMALKHFPRGLYTLTDSNYDQALEINKRLGFEHLNTIVVGGREHERYFLEGAKYGSK